METACQEIVNCLQGRNLIFSSEFWLCDDAWRDVWTGREEVDKVELELAEVVRLAYVLCDGVFQEYNKFCKKMLTLLYARLLGGEDGGDEVDGGIVSDFVCGEMHLRRLYVSLRRQNFLGADAGDAYVGSRQQCLYGCICFVYLLFEVCGNFDFVGLKGVDWLMETVFNGGSMMVAEEEGGASCGISEKRLLSMVGSVKPVYACLFDLVNTKNPSGGMVGPGNCRWFHDLILWVSGSVGEWYGKMVKNHAALHDAFGFLINYVGVGPGYTFGYHKKDVMRVGGSVWSRWCIMGQLSGLFAV